MTPFAEAFLFQLPLVCRILLAGFLGSLLGYERQSRHKLAGIRTHVIISVAAALMTILSKYGFHGVLGEFVRVDPSRVASSVVAAIGFIGSGVIYFKNNRVIGLTTSAGIWATVGIGMSIGAGMYLLGLATTLIILLVELFLGRKGALADNSAGDRHLQIEFSSMEDEGDALAEVTHILKESDCIISQISVTRKNEGVSFTSMVSISPQTDIGSLTCALSSVPRVKKVTL